MYGLFLGGAGTVLIKMKRGLNSSNAIGKWMMSRCREFQDELLSSL
jgi:hypothetical protein